MKIVGLGSSSPATRGRALFSSALLLLASLLLAVLVLLAPGDILVSRASYGVALSASGQTDGGATAADATLLSPDNDLWYDFLPGLQWAGAPATCTVTVTDPDGLKPNTTRYRTSTDGGGTWTEWSSTNITASLAMVSSTVFITVTDLAFPDSDSLNRIRFRIEDRDDPNNLEESDAYTVLVDGMAPDSSVATTGYFNLSTPWPGQIHGAASDAASGVQYVDITILRESPAEYWDGFIWQGSPVWLRASGEWSYVFSPEEGKTHTIESLATDNAGNVQAISATGVFTYDVTAPAAPTITLITPEATYTGDNCFTVTWESPLDYSGIAGAYYKFNAAPVSNADYDDFDPTGDITTLPCVAVPAEGKNDIYVWLVDGAGNADYRNHDEALQMLWYDAGEPESSIATGGYYGGPTVWPGQIEGTASDAGSDVQYVDITIQKNSTGGYWDGSTWRSPPIWLRATGGSGGWSYAFGPETDESYSVQSIATDNASNVQSIAATSVFTYDVVAPLAPVITLVAPEAVFTSTNCFTVTWDSPTDYSGIAGAYYKFNSPPVSNDDGVFVAEEGISGLSCLSVPEEGKNDIYIWLADGVGNADYHNRAERLEVFWYDATAPLATVAGYDRQPDYGTWFTDTVTLMLECSDPGDGPGCAYIEWRQQGELDWIAGDEIVVSDDSRRSYEYRAVDSAENTQDPPGVTTVPIDTHPPATSHQLSQLPGPSGWVNVPVMVTLSVSDVVSGEAVTHYRVDDGPVQTGKSFEIHGEGSHKAEYHSRDNAGNTEDWNRYSGLVNIDSVSPTTVADTTSVNGCEGWLTDESVTVHLAANDPTPGSGLDYTEYLAPGGSWQQGDSFAETREGTWAYQYRSVDIAENVEQARIVTLGIDRSAPGVPRNLQASPATWTNVPTFTLTWDDPLVPEDVSPIDMAYYKLDVAPGGDYDGVSVPPDGNSILVTVQGEGVHGVSLWLRDCAGNIDYHNNRQELQAFKYDASPPETGCVVSGTQNDGEWYVSPVEVTLLPEDTYSGVASTHYRVGDGAWEEGTSFELDTQGFRQKVEYYSIDLAGNEEAVSREWISIDTVAPRSPTGLIVQPSACSQENDFSAQWDNPTDDLSGIGGVFYKVGGVPLGPLDYTGFVDHAVESIPSFELPGQAEYGFYVWLGDGAGNADYLSYAMATACYDSTPPTTDAAVTAGTLGLGGWYMTPVTVRLTSSDAVAGLQRIDYRVDGGSWRPNVVSGKVGFVAVEEYAEGVHAVEYRALDQAGNQEAIGQFTVKIDSTAPVASVFAPSYMDSTSFDVAWEGQDPTPGGSVAFYDVQYRRDLSGGWTNWKIGTTSTSATFTNADRGHVYYFSVSATDAAGRRGLWSASDAAYTWVDPIQNGGFGGELNSWTVQGALPVKHLSSSLACGTGPEIVLGDPDLGPAEYGVVPIGRAAVSQRIRVPWAGEAPAPSLSLKYRMWTYDYMNWPNNPQDSFDVVVRVDGGGEDLVLRDGVLRAEGSAELGDQGCKEFTLDLSDYAGKWIRIELANWNRNDNLYNTWTYVDDVRVFLPSTVYLPVVFNGHPHSGGADVQMEGRNEPAAGSAPTMLEWGHPREDPAIGRPPR